VGDLFILSPNVLDRGKVSHHRQQH